MTYDEMLDKFPHYVEGRDGGCTTCVPGEVRCRLYVGVLVADVIAEITYRSAGCPLGPEAINLDPAAVLAVILANELVEESVEYCAAMVRATLRVEVDA